MPDQPTTPNAARINAMLKDLAAQKSGAQPQSVPPGPAPVALRPSAAPTPPPNLPTSGPRLTPPPMPQRPPVQPKPAVAIPPRPIAPPPPPREPAVSVVPTPKPAAPTPADPSSATPTPTVLQKPASADVSTEMRTMAADIGNLKVGQAPQGIRTTPAPTASAPTAPEPVPAKPLPSATPPATPPMEATPLVIVPPPPQSSRFGRKIIYVLLALLIIVLIGYGLISLLNPTETPPKASATPTASTPPTTTPLSVTLSSYFGAPAELLNMDDVRTHEDLVARLTSIIPPGGTARHIKPSRPVLFNNPDLEATYGADIAFIVFGQRELFGDNGAPLTGGTVEARLAFIYEITDAEAASSAMRALEGSALTDYYALLFGYDPSKAVTQSYSDGMHRNTPLRYRNFPYGDRSLDWAVVQASNQKHYLVVASSKEATFFVIDHLIE